MRLWSQLRSWSRTVLRRSRMESEMDAELKFHMDAYANDLVRCGVPREEAMRRARLEFGGIERAKEECRDATGVTFLESLAQDIRYGLRMLRKSPGFTAVAVLTLALGIGANTAIFSLIDGVILRPLPYANSSSLVMLAATQDGSRDVSSYPEFVDWKEQSHSYRAMAAFAGHDFNWMGKGQAESLFALRVSPGIFSLLGTQPILGRDFGPDEIRPGKSHVAILSNELWVNRFASDPGIIGTTITLDEAPYVIIGITPAGFHFPPTQSRPGLYVPLEPDPDRGHGFIRVLAQLEPGATIKSAQGEINAISERLVQAYPNDQKGRKASVQSLRASVVENVQGALWILCGAVGFVLLIACANIANLLLARCEGRRKEFAVRAALGAGRRRLTHQLLIESLLLGIAGGLLGLVVAYWSLNGIVALLGNHIEIPRLREVRINGAVLAYTFVVVFLTSILFGLAPALSAAKTDLNESLKEGSRNQSFGASRNQVRGSLVVIEVALAMILLAGAGLMIQTFVRLTRVNVGFKPEKVLALETYFPRGADLSLDRRSVMLRQILERMRTVPGVSEASTVTDLPLGGGSDAMGITLPGRRDVTRPFGVQFNVVSPRYFAALGIPILEGRDVASSDIASAPRVAVINEIMARRYWPQTSSLGKQFALSGDPKPFTIVGVVGNVRDIRLTQDAEAMAFVSCYQDPFLWRYVAFAIRTTSDPTLMASAVRSAIWSDYPTLPITRESTLDAFLGEKLAQPRAIMVLFASFAGLAIVLAGVGLFGVISYTVSQGTHDLGVRMTLGAQPRDILRLVVGRGLLLALGGLAVGIAGALLLTRLLSDMLYGVTAADPVTYFLVSVSLVVVALIASIVPARRAMRVDPMVALRYE